MFIMFFAIPRDTRIVCYRAFLADAPLFCGWTPGLHHMWLVMCKVLSRCVTDCAVRLCNVLTML